MPHLTHGRRVPGNAFTAQSRRALRWPLPLRDARLSTGPPQKRPSKMRRGTAGMPTVLITGANRGLGLEFARQYATSGWRVIATSRAPEKADALHALGQRVSVHRLDVADLAAVAGFPRAHAGESIGAPLANARHAGARRMTGATGPARGRAWGRAL